MTWGLVAVAGATLVGGIASSNAQRSAGNQASDAQQAAADAGIAQQNKQFEAIQALLKPYVDAGGGALTGQQNLAGLNGNNAQAQAIEALKNSPQFTSQLALGENSILQNASATGGLRGGNTQGALAQFSPQLLAQTINDQYSRLGGLTSLGQNSAAMTGNAGMQSGNQITGLLQQQGAAQAGAYLNQGKQTSNMWNAAGSAIGSFAGSFGGSGGAAASASSPYSLAGSGVRFSDARLKTDISPAGIAANGLPLYRFRYLHGSPVQIGHMAHEVAAVFPDAVSTHASGFLMVDYTKV